MLVTSLVAGCDLGSDYKKCYPPVDQMPIEVLPNATVGKPYYAEIAIGGSNQRINFFKLDENGQYDDNDSNWELYGLKWEFTDKYRTHDPMGDILSDSITIYGTPNTKGMIRVHAYSTLRFSEFFGTKYTVYIQPYNLYIKAEDE